MEHQRPLLLSDSRHKIAVCGRRWGKTIVGLLCSLMGHGPTRGHWPGAMDGARICWVARTYKDAEEIIWPQLKAATRDIALRTNSSEHRVELATGGVVKVASAENEDSLRGPGWDGIIQDEVAFQDETVWTKALRPTLATTNGWSLKIGTPNGFNWFEKHYKRAKANPQFFCLERPSWDNPLIPPEEIEAMREELGQVAFDQECGARFVSIEGAEFPASYFEDHIWANHWPEPDAFDWRIVSVDPSVGRDAKKGDYSAIVKLGLRDGVYWVDCDLQRRPVPQLVNDCLDAMRDFRPMTFGIESNAWQFMLAREIERELLARDWPPLPTTLINNQVHKIFRIQRLGKFLEQRLLRFRQSDGCQLLINQAREFPQGEHDDGPDALEMALRLSPIGNVIVKDERWVA